MIIKNLNLQFGIETIFDDVSVVIPDNEKIGVVGVNGAGKTTLFKVILKMVEADSGHIEFPKNSRIAWLPQVLADEVLDSDITVFDYLLEGRPIAKLEQEIASLYEKIASDPENKENDKLLKKISFLQDRLDYFEPFEAESILLKLIDGMKIEDELLYQSLKSLSGGQKSKIAFLRLLYSKPEILLLDEPTNHLDHTTKEYITNYLKNYDGSVFIISHDIEFLNTITNKTLYLDKRHHKLELFDGNYTKFMKILEEREKRLEKEAAIQEKEKEKLEEIIRRYIRGNEKKAKIAKDRQKKLARLEENMVTVEKKNKTMNFQLHQGRESTSFPLILKDVCFKYDKSAKRNLLYKINLEIPRGEKFLIVGENGVGKSTLLKLIVGELIPDKGEIILGSKTDLGYYAQEHDLLDNEKTLIDNFDEFDLTLKQLKGILGKFLFFEDDLYKTVKILSPGERSRLALAKLTLMKANVLILDEPTNHLDPESQKIIANNLKSFPGTIILVSHNTAFVDNLGIERTLILPEGKLDYYDVGIVEKYQILNTKPKKKH